MRNVELDLALLLVILVCGFLSYRFKLARLRKLFKEREHSNMDEQIRAIEVLKEQLKQKEQCGEKATLAIVEKTSKDRETGKEVFTKVEEEIGKLDDLEKKIKDAYKSGGNVRMTVRRAFPDEQKHLSDEPDQQHK